MSPRQRRQAVRAAFVVDPKRGTQLEDCHVALVDDVYTSGATAEACVRTLLAAGAARVVIACWARVVAEEPAD
jgi:predicted amidophosphoribosyltransferase